MVRKRLGRYLKRVEVIRRDGRPFGIIQKVRDSRRAETLGQGQYRGPTQTETRAGEKTYQETRRIRSWLAAAEIGQFPVSRWSVWREIQ